MTSLPPFFFAIKEWKENVQREEEIKKKNKIR